MVAAPSAQAAFPGANGKLVLERFDGTHFQIYTINPNGTNLTQLTNDGLDHFDAKWSPDGTKIAFASGVPIESSEIYMINADGTGRTQLTGSGGSSWSPTWSPDGTKIAFIAFSQIYTMNADGTNQRPLESPPPGPDERNPAWSPNGTKLAYNTEEPPYCTSAPCQEQIYTVNADGTNPTPILSPGFFDRLPVWSPDGTKIAFQTDRDDPDPVNCLNGYPYPPCQFDIHTMNSDGTGQTRLTTAYSAYPAWSPDGKLIAFNGSGGVSTIKPDGTNQTLVTTSGSVTDWQPIPINTYPRPRGATPVYASLVPAFKPCTAPNDAHGAPLSYGSCNPPVQTSDYLTVGAPPQEAANSVGSVLMRAFSCPACVGPGPNADVRFDASITDVRNKNDLSDYTGELQADAALRITDKNNTPSPGGPGAGTVSDTHFPFTVPCAATSDPTVGSTCSVSTSANAIMPNSVLAGQRAIWELGQVKVYDGGLDGVASTTADNTLFMDQGVFVP
jgi:Tol biopolymer transport system component